VRDLSGVIKAYDVRGVVGPDLDVDLVADLGAAFTAVIPGATAVVLGRDMRPSSPDLLAAFAHGVRSRGLDVIDIGLASTDQLYFASGSLDLPGAMFTASHNPAKYNGIKLCRAGATPVGQASGLAEIKVRVETGDLPPAVAETGSLTHRDLLSEYADYLRSLVGLDAIRPLRVVVDAGNGMAGHTVPAVLGDLPGLDLVALYFELDGSFPNHEANPIDPANLVDLQARVLAEGADLGLAFDGDADRCFVVDERGDIVSPSTLTGLIAAAELRREPGSTVIHNLITSRSVPEIVTELGGTPVRTRVGHSFIKAQMAETGAIFGGEHSGHFYFRDFWRADSGMLAALHALSAVGSSTRPASQIFAEYIRYAASGEINTAVADAAVTAARIEAAFAGRSGAVIDHLDGLTVTAADWWFNVRPSNTEPLLRLNAEGVDELTMVSVRDEVLALIAEEA
jgi:phosphomannomutase